MRTAFVLASLVFTPLVHGSELTEQQQEPWKALQEQVALDIQKDLEAEKKYLHPKGCFWGDQLPAPISPSASSYSYRKKWLEGQDEIVGHHMIPVSVVVVDDVAIINFYLHILTRDDEGEQEERIIRGHNTWKKNEDGQWQLLATYNTKVDSEEDDD